MSTKSQIELILDAINGNLANQSSPLSSLPRLLFSEDISKLTGRSITTIRHYTGNSQKFGHLLPQWFKLPGSRRLAWLEGDVLAWIQAGQTTEFQPKRHRGRPTKAEQLANEKRNIRVDAKC